jgi:hypothetical protein
VQFPQRPHERPSSERPSNNQTAQENKKITLNGELAAASRHEMVAQPAPVEPQVVPESRYILLIQSFVCIEVCCIMHGS